MTEAPKLLPCPFCGEAPRMEAYAGDVGGVHIECLTPDCPASPISTGGSMTDPLVAWNAWNRRHDAAVSAARKEGMRVKALEWQMRVPRYSTGNKLYPVASWDDLEFFIGALALEKFKLPDGGYSRTFGCYCSSDPRAARLSPGPDGEYAFATEDEAKAAAQADYEARILSALETTP